MKSIGLPGAGTRSSWAQKTLIPITSILYALALVPLGATVTLAALPAALGGALLGLRAGLIAGLLGFLLNALLLSLAREPVLAPTGLLSGVLVVSGGVMAGGLRDLLTRSRNLANVRTSLERESARREQVEQELERFRETAAKADQARTEFLSRIGHDVRTPVSVIIGYCELLIEQSWDVGTTDLVPDLEKILMASQDLLAFVDDILNLSRIERGKTKLYPELFELKTLIRDLVAEARPLVERTSNTLNVRFATESGSMRADPMKTQQVLLNILRHTTRFTHQGLVTLSIAREADPDGAEWIRFHVANTGTGMAPEHRQHILESLTQAEDSGAYQHDAVALGLTISRLFCQIMGGAIYGESTTDTGFALTVRLPVDGTEHQDETALPVQTTTNTSRA